jgi:hypothetical protein
MIVCHLSKVPAHIWRLFDVIDMPIGNEAATNQNPDNLLLIQDEKVNTSMLDRIFCAQVILSTIWCPERKLLQKSSC